MYAIRSYYVLVLTLGLGVYNASAARTIDLNSTERTLYKYGADVIMQTVWEETPEAPTKPPTGQGQGGSGGGGNPGGGNPGGGNPGGGGPGGGPGNGQGNKPTKMNRITSYNVCYTKLLR